MPSDHVGRTAPGCTLATTPPVSRAARLEQYLMVLGDGVCKTYAQFETYVKDNQQDYEQIHLDCLRSLWTFFQKGTEDVHNDMTSSQHRQRYKAHIGKELPHSFVRLHQSVLERVIVDALSQNLTFKCYFQGYTYVIETLYYTALKDEYLYPDSAEMTDLLAAFAADGTGLYLDSVDNYQPYTGNFAERFNFQTMFIIPYAELLHLALEISRSTLFPFLHLDNKAMVATVSLAFEPIMRMVDAELYAIIANHPSIGITCQAIQTAAVMTGCISLSSTPYGRSRFLDALVAGGIQLTLFLSAASFSLGARFYLPHIFSNYVPATTNATGADSVEEGSSKQTRPSLVAYTGHHMLLLSRSSICESPYYPPIDENIMLNIATFHPITGPPIPQDDECITTTIKNAFTKVEQFVPRLVDYAINFACVIGLLSMVSSSFLKQSKGLFKWSHQPQQRRPSSPSSTPPTQTSSDTDGCSSPSGPTLSPAPNTITASALLDTNDADMLSLFKHLSTEVPFVRTHDGLYNIIMKDIPFPMKATEPKNYYRKIASGRFVDFSRIITFVDPKDSLTKYYSFYDICESFNFRLELYISLLQESKKYDDRTHIKDSLIKRGVLVDCATLEDALCQMPEYKPFTKRNAPIIVGIAVATVAVIAGVVGGIIGGLSLSNKRRSNK
ncbi:Hypothetical protein GSB_150694 [Giardia duodenalis]|uniref:Uncharacterized protein n=1 Tax=Giardia intestinalis TaxID=5741 RepID=V6TZJ2_GIAIN|nr:Hypothetical protein GSB_150694 [Giardia intestinalis]